MAATARPAASTCQSGPDADIEIKYCFKHTQRRDPKDQPDADRFAEKSHERHRDREREQVHDGQLTHILPPRNRTVGSQKNRPAAKVGTVTSALVCWK
jgi:hypothetical protein